MNNPLVSVIIPTYNRKDTLPGCIKSILDQSYKNTEVIVIDDASTDGTQELFETGNFPQVKYFRYNENKGACYARNYGAQRTKGEIIAFQDSDDIWHSDKLEKQIELLFKTNSDMCFCGINRVSHEKSAYYFPVHDFDPNSSLEQILAENRAGTQTMVMRRCVWENLKFDESFRRYQDWDFAIRAAEKYKLCYLPLALVDSRVGNDSISFAVKSYPALKKLYDKHIKLYEKYPGSNAVMNRRMGKRLSKSEPELSAQYFLKAFKLCKNPYDMGYYLYNAFLSKLSF